MADKFNPQYVWFIVALKSRRRLNTHLTHRQLHNEDIRNLETNTCTQWGNNMLHKYICTLGWIWLPICLEKSDYEQDNGHDTMNKNRFRW